MPRRQTASAQAENTLTSGLPGRPEAAPVAL